MSNRQFDTRTETKSSLSRQPVKRREQGHVAETSIFPKRDPLPRAISSVGNLLSASTHAAMLKCATSGRQSRARQSLLQLQRQYGNRYVQRVLDLARKGTGEAEASPEVEESIQRARGSGQALDKGVQRQMESAFGADFGDVRVHTDTQSDTLNRQLSALAFTTGQDIFFRHGAYNPGASSGRELLAHELTHVVQQTSGVRRRLTVGQSGDKYEQEADQVARAVMQQEQQFAQRQVEEAEEEEPAQMKTEFSLVQRQSEEEGEEPVQAKLITPDIPTIRRQEELEEEEESIQTKRMSSHSAEVTHEIASSINALRGSIGQPSPKAVRDFFEPRFGYDFSQVNGHTDILAGRISEAVNAKAPTVGKDAVFGNEHYAPATTKCKTLLAHELTHTVQQGENVQEKVQRAEELRQDYPWEGVVYNCSYVNFRRTATSSTNTNIIRALRAETRVTVIGRTGSWLNVRYGSRTGYIYRNYINDVVSSEFEEAISTGEEATWVPSGPSSTNSFATWARRASGRVANATRVNFRSAPTIDTNIISVLSQGTAVSVLGVSGNWYEIEHSGTTGYMHKDYVNIATLPLNASTEINCWEVVLLMAYRAGRIDWEWINNLYTNVAYGPNGSGWITEMSSAASTQYDRNDPNTPVPASGEIVFWNGLAHVALGTGNIGHDGSPDVYTFWPPPGQSSVPGTLDQVKTSTINELSDYIASVPGWGGQPTVAFGPPNW